MPKQSSYAAGGALVGDELFTGVENPSGTPATKNWTANQLVTRAPRVVSTGTASIDSDDGGRPVYFSTTCTVTLEDAAPGTRVLLVPAGGDLTLVAGSGVSAVVPATVAPAGTALIAFKFDADTWVVLPRRKLANALGDVVIDVDPAGNGSTKRIDVTSAEGVRIDGALSTKRLNIVPDTYAGVAPPRGLVNRETVAFAWGVGFVNVSLNTVSLSYGHNVASLTYVNDQRVAVTFHNAASSADIAPNVNIAASGLDAYATLFASTGFDVRTSLVSGSNYSFSFAVFTRDLT